ncbi:MAG: hypothetical protein ABH824_06680 [Nanoarchaeota archaeon]|nr:hypothetical protein [Nanoarchaeota archaeon]MBU1631720.1 hypothetical protein [Nanoarchaeota archaeon]MBU1876218.1 hypothetical protein [Nanoarchaeota archaeon]
MAKIEFEPNINGYENLRDYLLKEAQFISREFTFGCHQREEEYRQDSFSYKGRTVEMEIGPRNRFTIEITPDDNEVLRELERVIMSERE